MMYVGLPQWSHPKWVRTGITGLEEYARHFNCVEGNTTLYALPRTEIVERWREQTTDDFRFCFKFPATISHNAALRNCDDLTHEFFTRMSPPANRVGQYWLQLPATFGPRDLQALWQFLDALPHDFTYGVEVRHPDFFAKGDAEKALNRGLHKRSVNRVILDSRPVHNAIPHSEAVVDAQRKNRKYRFTPLLPRRTRWSGLSAAITCNRMKRCSPSGCKRSRNGSKPPPRTCFYIRRILPGHLNWSMLSGRPCSRRFRRLAPRRPSHNNLLFSEITPYHRDVPSAKNRELVWSARCMRC